MASVSWERNRIARGLPRCGACGSHFCATAVSSNADRLAFGLRAATLAIVIGEVPVANVALDASLVVSHVARDTALVAPVVALGANVAHVALVTHALGASVALDATPLTIGAPFAP